MKLCTEFLDKERPGWRISATSLKFPFYVKNNDNIKCETIILIDYVSSST